MMVLFADIVQKLEVMEFDMANKKDNHYTCRKCRKFNKCGQTMRTEPCESRQTRQEYRAKRRENSQKKQGL